MKIRLGSLVLFAAAVFVGTAALSFATEAPKPEATLAPKLIAAIENSDYASFIADGETPFRQFKKEQFDAVVALLGPKLKAGHELAYLGELKQQGYHVTLWKIEFKGGGDDALATLSVKDGKVGGFWIR